MILCRIQFIFRKHSNICIQGTPINEKLPARGLCHPEQKGCLKSQHSLFLNSDPREEEQGWNIHHCPGGWSVPIPPIKRLYHNTKGNHSIEYRNLLE